MAMEMALHAAGVATETRLHVLIVDDVEDDALLAEEVLRRGGYSVVAQRVETAAALDAALNEQLWDLILCDYRMPRFSGLEALALVRRRGLDLPFILVSGTVGEETAVAALQAGADDYVMKGNSTRLVPSVQRALRDVSAHRQRRQAEEALRASEGRYRRLVETSPDAILLLGLQGGIQMANMQAAALYHHISPQALIGLNALDLLVPADRERGAAALSAVAVGAVLSNLTYIGQREDGTTFTLEVQATRVDAEGIGATDSTMIVARDVTARNEAEERLRFQAHLLETVGQSIVATDVMGAITYWNRAAETLYGWTAVEAVGQNILAILPTEPFRVEDAEILASLVGGDTASAEYMVRHRSGREIPILASTVPIYSTDGAVVGIIGISTDISMRVQAEEALRQSEERFRALFEHAPAGIALLDPQGGVVVTNTYLQELLGYTAAELCAHPFTTFTHPEDRATDWALYQDSFADGRGSHALEKRLLHRDGHIVWVSVARTLLREKHGSAPLMLDIVQDITARKQAEEEARRSEERARAQFQGLPVPTYTWQRQGDDWILVDYNRAAERITDGAIHGLLGTSVRTMYGHIPEIWDNFTRCWAEQTTIEQAAPYRFQFTGMDKYLLISYVFVPPDMVLVHTIDITERICAEESLRHQALHDNLTDLPNRTLLYERIAVSSGDDLDAPRPLALLLFDLDHFKEINDAFGHQRGDTLLRETADRILGALRTGDTVARLGGDEFAVLLPGADAEEAGRVATAIRTMLDVPLKVDGQLLRVTASAGIALAPAHGKDGATLLRRADMAMYAAKGGRLGQAFYEPAQDQHSQESLARTAELREAIECGALILHYQPQVELAGGRVCGVEALVRWPHPVHGLVPPDQFIPLAERTGLIAPLTDWVLTEAIRQCKEWQRKGILLGVSVNLSMWNLRDPALPDRIADLLRIHGLSSAWLRLELTESALMTDTERTMDVLARLSALGIHLAVDDFGTGYSSLTYLKKLPVDELKIDRSFVRELATDATDAAIVASTVALGHALGLRVVAEGIEDQATWTLLAGMHCDVAQGYHIARPLPPDALVRWLRESPWAVA